MTSFAAERPAFFEGQYLGAMDLTALVKYFRTQEARQILGHHTWGIAVGLNLIEVQAADGTWEVYVQPGVAFDGYGRVIAMLNRTKLDAELFTGAPSGEVDVWIRYDESQKQGVRKGFEVCSTDDVFSRVNESYALVVGAKSSISERESGVKVNGETLADAREALRVVDENAPLLCDGSVPHQEFPAEEDDPCWLVPLGLVHWQGGSPGSFQTLTPEQQVRSRRKRRYIGVVTEALYAADGVIRLRNRHSDYDAAETTDTLCESNHLAGKDLYICNEQLQARELVWLEGHVRITGDTRLFAGRLEFRNSDGHDYIERTVDGVTVPASTPLLLQRKENNFRKGTDLQILLGQSDAGINRLSVGRIAFSAPAPGGGGTQDDPLCAELSASSDNVVIQDDGKMGIGAVDSTLASPLTIRGIDEEDELLAFEDDSGQCLWQINLGPNKDGFNIVETQSDASRLFIAHGGHVGLGTTEPIDPLHIKGDDADIFLDINSTSVNSLSEIRFGSDGAYDSKIAWSKTNKKTYINSHGTNAMVLNGQNIGVGTDEPAVPLHITAGSDVHLDDDAGHLVLGSINSTNVAFDDNEIQARNNGKAAILYVQLEGGDFAVHRSSSSRFVVKNDGKVGIGTSNPAEKLDVRGDIKLGASGNLFAPGGVENLRIIVGRVDSSGSVVQGIGFSVRYNGVGRYTVNFSSRFSANPVVVVSPVDSDNIVTSVHNLGLSSFQVHTEQLSGITSNPYNTEFSFIAMGER